MATVKESGLELVQLNNNISKERELLHKKVYVPKYHVCIHVAYGDLDLSIWHEDREVASSIQLRVPPVGELEILCTGGYTPDEVYDVVKVISKQLDEAIDG